MDSPVVFSLPLVSASLMSGSYSVEASQMASCKSSSFEQTLGEGMNTSL
jgi:hypothetical protein